MSKPTTRNIHININGKEVVNSFSGISKAMRETHRDIANLNKNDKDYVEQLAKHRATLHDLKVKYAETRAEIGRMPEVIKNTNSQLKDLGVDLIKGFTIGTIISKAIIEFQSAKETIIEFDQAQANLAGVMETTKKGVSELTEDAKKYGATTSYTATQVSGLQLELAKLGKTESEIKSMTKGVLDAAVALEAELGPAAELVGGQLNSFGEDASQAQRYADVMANSANISATSFESLATALPKVSAVAAQSNITFERTNAVLGVLADQNVAAETSGTGFRNILLESAKQGKHYETMLSEIASSTDATRVATEMFGKENATVAVILAKNFDKVEIATNKLENSVGSAAALAETKLDSVTGAQQLFNSAWEGMILSFDDGNGVISKVTQRIYDLGIGIINLIAPTQKMSEATFKEQVELNGLVRKITDTNKKNTDRLNLLDKLKDNYPGFINMIGDEELSNANLNKVLLKINENYRERIKLQQQAEKIDDLTSVRDSFAGSSIKTEEELFNKLVEIQAKHNHNYKINQEDLARSANDYISVYGGQLSWFEKKQLNLLKKNLDFFQENEKRVNKSIDIEKKGLKDINTLEEKRVEIKNKVEGTETTVSSTSSNSGALKKTNKTKKNTEKEIFERGEKEINEILQRSKEQRELQILEGYAREEAQINKKFAREIEKYASHKSRIVELEAARDAELLLNRQKAEQEVAKLTENSQQTIENHRLKGIAREEAQITQKYAKEAEKYKGQKDLILQLEATRDAEIAEARRLRTEEYDAQTKSIEEQNHLDQLMDDAEADAEKITKYEERALFMLEKAREIALIELDIEREKELAKVEAVEGAEELKSAIREKYARQADKISTDFTVKAKQLETDKVKWTELTEDQKLNLVKGSLNAGAEAFNEGSGAWKATKIAETTISTYQAATNSFNSLSGIPVVGPALGAAAAALAVVTGLKNIQKISNTPLQKMPTHYYGGYTGNQGNGLSDGYGNITGMVHENEWVSPAFMTQSPKYAPIINWLENEREMQLNGVTGSSQSPFFDNPVFQALAVGVKELSEILDGGIVAKTFYGYEDMEKHNRLNEELQKSKNNSKISS